jgi:hypothetical protein
VKLSTRSLELEIESQRYTLIACWSVFDPIIQVQLTWASLIKCEMGKGGSQQRSSGKEKA